jgi:hypothetical protein
MHLIKELVNFFHLIGGGASGIEIGILLRIAHRK